MTEDDDYSVPVFSTLVCMTEDDDYSVPVFSTLVCMTEGDDYSIFHTGLYDCR